MTRIFIDNAIPDIDEVREQALKAKYEDFIGGDGGKYIRVSEANIPSLHRMLGDTLERKICHLKGGFRLNYRSELPNSYIHSDERWAKWACVLYLDPSPPEGNGTAFWRHEKTGATTIPFDLPDVARRVTRDWTHPEEWEMIDFIPAKYNRVAIYSGEYFHSRFPFAGYGTTPEDGRLIYTGFFNARKVHDRS